jgi:transposase
MRFDLENLPSDTALLHRLVREMAAVVESRTSEIERLQSIIKKLQRAQFGRRSERLDADQLALALEDLDGDIARIRESRPIVIAKTDDGRPKRKPLPDHLPREDIMLAIASDICGCCGGALHAIGESVSEMLDWVPAQLRVVRIVRPKYACRSCNKVMQAAAPERLIAGGLATPALLAQVLVSKYCDHTPLYRQSQILARHGVDLGRSTLAGWVGGVCWWLETLHERLCKNVFASDHLFADDTPIPVLDPGRGRTKTGRLWVYAREQRPWSGPEPPAAVYLFAPDRKAERPVAHLAHFKGILHVDGYVGFERLLAMAISCSPPAGRTRGASSTRSLRRQVRPWQPRPCAGSANSTPSKRACADSRPLIGLPSGAPSPGRSCKRCIPGWKCSFRASPVAARLPRQSVTRSRAGKV